MLADSEIDRAVGIFKRVYYLWTIHIIFHMKTAKKGEFLWNLLGVLRIRCSLIVVCSTCNVFGPDF